MDKILLNEDIFLGFTVGNVIYSSYCLLSILLPGVIFAAFYRILRPKLPARVNCWFCNRNTFVPYNARNCWDCPQCDQYNGFTDSGDYNIDIHGKMLSSNSSGIITSSPENEPTNGLCERCNINQRLKIHQLARFKPINENDYDEEVDRFREQLDNNYKLCEACEKVLHKTLRKQKVNILTNRMNDHRKNDVGAATGAKTLLQPTWMQMGSYKVVALRKISLALLSTMIASTAISFYKPTLLKFLHLDNHSFIEITLEFLKSVTFFISASGTVLYLMSNLGTKTRKSDVCLSLWFLLTFVSLLDFHSIFLSTSILTFFFHCQTIRNRTLFFPRKDLIKISDFQETKPSIIENKLPNLNNVITESLKKPASVDEPNTVEADAEDMKKNLRKRIRVQKIELTPSKIVTRSKGIKKGVEASSVGNSAVLTKKDSRDCSLPPEISKNDPRARHFSPPPELYEGLLNLHVSPMTIESIKKPEKLEKMSNDLIKPAKFVPSFSTFTATESSRSSTPKSVGQSSAVTHITKSECNSKIINSDTCHQISPLFNKFNPSYPCSFDCNEFASYDNVHHNLCFPGYSPFQMYSTPMGPLGHASVYTYTRPPPFPYAFPQPRFTPHYDYLSPMSPRISELGNSSNGSSANLFLSQSEDKWSWLKQCAFAVCVLSVINVIGWVSYWYTKT